MTGLGRRHPQRPPLSCIAGALDTILEYRPDYDMGVAICRSVVHFPPLDSATASTSFLRQACRLWDVTPLFSKLLASTILRLPIVEFPSTYFRPLYYSWGET